MLSESFGVDKGYLGTEHLTTSSLLVVTQKTPYHKECFEIINHYNWTGWIYY